MSAVWTVYIIETNTPNMYYVGITENIKKRIRGHKSGNAATVTRMHGVKTVDIVAQVKGEHEAKTLEKEAVLQLRREGKDAYGAGWLSAPFPESWLNELKRRHRGDSSYIYKDTNG